MEMKTCRLCGQSKPMDTEHFYMRKKYKGGWSNECRPCFRIMYQQRYGQKKSESAVREDRIPTTARTERIDVGNGVVRVVFGLGFKPGKGQTHGSRSGYASALANNLECPG